MMTITAGAWYVSRLRKKTTGAIASADGPKALVGTWVRRPCEVVEPGLQRVSLWGLAFFELIPIALSNLGDTDLVLACGLLPSK